MSTNLRRFHRSRRRRAPSYGRTVNRTGRPIARLEHLGGPQPLPFAVLRSLLGLELRHGLRTETLTEREQEEHRFRSSPAGIRHAPIPPAQSTCHSCVFLSSHGILLNFSLPPGCEHPLRGIGRSATPVDVVSSRLSRVLVLVAAPDSRVLIHPLVWNIKLYPFPAAYLSVVLFNNEGSSRLISAATDSPTNRTGVLLIAWTAS